MSAGAAVGGFATTLVGGGCHAGGRRVARARGGA